MQFYPANQLTIDMSVYPRKELDGDHVFNLTEALRAGVKLPPIVICKKSKRVVDGAHRLTAMQRIFGADVDVECIEKSYQNEAELFLDAVKYNAAHGKNLTRDDRARVAEIGDRLQVDHSRLSGALSISEAALGGLSAAASFGSLSSSRNPRNLAKGNRPLGDSVGRKLDQDHREKVSSGLRDFHRSRLIGSAGPGNSRSDYTAEIERLSRASEIVGRIDWNDPEIQANEVLMDRFYDLRAACVTAIPISEGEYKELSDISA